MLRATTACTFSTSQLPKVVRTWRALYILTWKCASRHGLQFFISHLASWLRTRRFSEVTFRPSGAPNHWKNTVNRDFPTFSRTCIFSLLTFSISYLLPTSAFPSLHIVGSLTSKLPSTSNIKQLRRFVSLRTPTALTFKSAAVAWQSKHQLDQGQHAKKNIQSNTLPSPTCAQPLL